MKIANLLLLLGLIFGSFAPAYGQENVLRGRVIDATMGEPLIGVSVAEFDEDNRIIGGTITDVN